MITLINDTNQIDSSAKIGANVKLGSYNIIGKNVIIEGFKNSEGIVEIGDCNVIEDGTRILAGQNGIKIGDWNVFHNNMLVMGDLEMIIGHNCWFGQNTILDSSGGLEIGNGVRVGMYSQIWTHVASGELIEGCTLYGMRKTVICDDVWLVGSCIVSSGITLAKRGIFLIGSNITKSTQEKKVYGGNPIKEMEKLNFYRDINLDGKFIMMLEWIKEFTVENKNYNYLKFEKVIIVKDENSNEKIIIIIDEQFYEHKNASIFCLKSKKYLKTLSNIERKFYKFIYNHKARFLPL